MTRFCSSLYINPLSVFKPFQYKLPCLGGDIVVGWQRNGRTALT